VEVLLNRRQHVPPISVRTYPWSYRCWPLDLYGRSRISATAHNTRCGFRCHPVRLVLTLDYYLLFLWELRSRGAVSEAIKGRANGTRLLKRLPSFGAPLGFYSANSLGSLALHFPCPFCKDRDTAMNVEQGSGVLTILVAGPGHLFPNEWRVVRVCKAHEVDSRDWAMAIGPRGVFQQMAWIPNPCGNIQNTREVVMGGQLRRELRSIKVSCSWRQPLRDPVKSRLAGIFSRLNGALLSPGGTEIE
jgi:hypothetical protein